MIRPETIEEADEALDWLFDASFTSAEWERVSALLDTLAEALAGEEDAAVLDAVAALDRLLQRGDWEEISEEEWTDDDDAVRAGEGEAPPKVRERLNKLKHALQALRGGRRGDDERD
ncbi:transglutaminase-like putative cysteine protease [Thermocatellispora tengchongensis]|uniref:Transglutaminase-like putative cysteine protease n=1 Tax=Thermocatellispora tengchongensis TaxID=1073253 RepID=A0A840P6I2_9ACTN|nr:CATRA system-associated protein [Thermocatellispora tengchongensis]MBB5133513.1 transglutaminase-like putative cysteine protease [Thermocatellispora tengchongensis]